MYPISSVYTSFGVVVVVPFPESSLPLLFDASGKDIGEGTVWATVPFSLYSQCISRDSGYIFTGHKKYSQFIANSAVKRGNSQW